MDIDPFIECLENSPDRSKDTIRAYRSDLVLFDRFLRANKLRITQVTSAVVHDYIKHLEAQPNPRFGKVGLSRATVRRHLISIRRYFAFLKATTNPKLRDPTYGIKIGNLDNDDCKAVDESTIANLLEGVTSARDKVLISLFLSSGLRLSELHQLDRETIEADHTENDGETSLFGTGEVVGKRRKKRRFYIDAETVDALVAVSCLPHRQQPRSLHFGTPEETVQKSNSVHVEHMVQKAWPLADAHPPASPPVRDEACKCAN